MKLKDSSCNKVLVAGFNLFVFLRHLLDLVGLVMDSSFPLALVPSLLPSFLL